jgi:AcrR family transcriptional regulator
MAKLSPAPPADPTRAKLLEAAGNVFAEQGFHAATVREICARAGANVAAVNYHFGDKAELYEEVLRLAIYAAPDAELRKLLADIPPEEALRRFIRYMIGRICSASRPGWAIRIMAHEMAHPTPALDSVIDEIIAPNYLVLRTLTGRFLGRSPDHEKTRFCAHSVIGQVIHYLVARPVIERLWPELTLSEKNAGRIADHIADFSLAYLTSARKSS